MVKTRTVLSTYAVACAAFLAIGCGSGVDSLNSPPTQSGKPTSAALDHSSSVQVLMLVNSVSYLNHATHMLFNLGQDLLTCQKLALSENVFFNNDANALGNLELKVTSNCVPPQSSYEGYSGIEKFNLTGAQRVSSGKEIAISFSSGTMTTPSPLMIYDRFGLRMTASHVLNLTASSNGNYQFELRTTWKTINTRTEAGLVGQWDTLVKGSINPEGRLRFGAEVSDLTASVDVSLSYLRPPDVAQTEETAHVSLTVSALTEPLSKEGYPTATLTAVYGSSLFPGYEHTATLYVNRTLLFNPDINSQLNLEASGRYSFPWTQNAVNAINYQGRTRGL